MRKKVKKKTIEKEPEPTDEKITEATNRYGHRYKGTAGLSKETMEALTAEEILWLIYHIASDKRDHILVYDTMCFLEYKMKEVKKLANFLERKKPDWWEKKEKRNGNR